MAKDVDHIRLRRALADLLRDRRHALGITQTDLADQLKTVQGTVSQLERGAFFPTLPRLLAIARILGIDTGELDRLLDDEPDGQAA